MRSQTFRLSVTTLEKFRRFTADTSSFDTEQALIEALTGKFEGNDKTRTGGAYHKIIEDPTCMVPVKRGNEVFMMVADEKDGYKIAFPPAAVAKAIAFRKQHPLLVYEIPVQKTYRLKKYNIVLSGRVDSIEGMHIRDAKTKYRAPSAISDYTDSLQWMAYLDILNLKTFHFDIFEVKRFKELKAELDGICYLDDIEIVPHDPITCLSYLSMNDYLHYMLEQFMQWVEFRDIFHMLKPVSNEPAAEPVHT